jgi:membrane protease YdiL (CAAX protease family)
MPYLKVATSVAIAIVGAMIVDFVLALVITTNGRIAPNVPWGAVALFVISIGFGAWQTSRGKQESSLNQWSSWWAVTSVVLGVVCLAAVQATVLSVYRGTYSVAEIGGEVAAAFIAIPVYSGAMEEFLFRGVVQTRLRSVVGRWSVALTAFLFVLVHLSRPDFRFQWPLFVAIALVCGWMAYKVSLLAAALIHVIYNVSVNAFLHFHGVFYFSESGGVRTALCVFCALVAGVGLVAIFMPARRCSEVARVDE